MKRTGKRKSAKISDAVFRGRKGEYTFEVYPLAAEMPEMPEAPAVFILSRRKVHRTGHVSHAASCIGETASILGELKRHKRAKCVKHNGSNVVCILREDSDKSRATVLDDIAGARTFGCIRNVFEPTMLRKPNVQSISATKTSAFIPSPALPLKPVRRKRVVLAPIAADNSEHKDNKSAAPVAAGGKRAGTKRRAASAKPAKAAGAKAKKPKTAAPAKRAAAAKPRTRVSRGVDRDRGQHRLSKQKGTVRGRAKTRTAGRTGTRKKAAA